MRTKLGSLIFSLTNYRSIYFLAHQVWCRSVYGHQRWYYITGAVYCAGLEWFLWQVKLLNQVWMALKRVVKTQPEIVGCRQARWGGVQGPGGARGRDLRSERALLLLAR